MSALLPRRVSRLALDRRRVGDRPWPRTRASTTRRPRPRPSRRRPTRPTSGRNFPTRPFFGDTHLHTAFSMDAGAFGARLTPQRRLPLRARRGDHRLERAAGEALAAARLPRGRRPLGQHGLLPRPLRRQAGGPRRPDGPQVVRHDPVRQGRARPRSRSSSPSRKGTFPKDLMYFPGTRAYQGAWQETIAAAEEYNEPGPLHRLHRLRVDVEHRAATTCTATSSSATTATRRARSSPSPSTRRSAATTRSTSGSGWTPTRRRPAAACSRSRTTATSATA